MPGPVPNRSEDLARPRERRGGDVTPVTKGVAREVKIPNASRDWHPIAKRLWESLKTSGQSDYYQNSDWAFAFSVCDDLSYYKKASQRSAMMLASLNSSMERLLVTEADRRRARIELDAPEADESEASVVVLDNYKQGLSLVPSPETT
jgi:hypothetical protein